MIRLGILSSTRGTHLAAIVEAIEQRQISASIACVISNKKEAPVLMRAEQAGIPANYIDATGMTREAYDERVSEALKASAVDLVVLIGYMRILSADFVNQWPGKMINVHPSLLPSFAGLMDLAVHQAVLDAGVSETGCTVHYVTEEVDAGPIVLQKKCAVLADDSVESLKLRVQTLEKHALIEAIQLISHRHSGVEKVIS